MSFILDYTTFKEISEKIKFNPDLVPKKNIWYTLDTKEIFKISDNIVDLIQTAYKNTELGSRINKKTDLKRSFFWNAIDLDNQPDADAIIFGRKSKYGIKIQGIGHDGQEISKESIIFNLVKVLNKKGFWIEASDALEHILYKNNVPYIKDEDVAQKMFPNSKLKMINDKGKYTRELSNGKVITETIFGNPIKK